MNYIPPYILCLMKLRPLNSTHHTWTWNQLDMRWFCRYILKLQTNSWFRWRWVTITIIVPATTVLRASVLPPGLLETLTDFLNGHWTRFWAVIFQSFHDQSYYIFGMCGFSVIHLSAYTMYIWCFQNPTTNVTLWLEKRQSSPDFSLA